MVATPVFDKCASEFIMKEKQTAKIKGKGTEERGLEKKAVGHGGGGAVPPARKAPVTEHQKGKAGFPCPSALVECLKRRQAGRSMIPSPPWLPPPSSQPGLLKIDLLVVTMTGNVKVK